MGEGNDTEPLGQVGTLVNLLFTNFEGTYNSYLQTLRRLTNCDSKFI